MKVRRYKNGVIKLTSESKRDSLNLLKFMHKAAGDNDPDRVKLIAEKESELEEEQFETDCETMGKALGLR